MYDITALGEILVDFTSSGYSSSGMRLFEQNPGGAPANLLVQASRLGMRCAFIGKAGDDMHGRMLLRTLSKEGIDTQGMILDKRYPTTLAFVETDENGERSFSFVRKASADTMLFPEEVRKDIIKESRIFHFGSLSLTDEPSASAQREAVSFAASSGCILSFDPNYREPLWDSGDRAVSEMKEMLCVTDVLKVSMEEAMLLTGESNPESAFEKLMGKGPKLIAVTLGEDGAFVGNGGSAVRLPARRVRAVDTTGAGDSFWGSFLTGMIRLGKDPEELTEEEIKRLTAFAVTAASICVKGRGGIPSMPSGKDLEKDL